MNELSEIHHALYTLRTFQLGPATLQALGSLSCQWLLYSTE
jgi:hypothetical protein